MFGWDLSFTRLTPVPPLLVMAGIAGVTVLTSVLPAFHFSTKSVTAAFRGGRSSAIPGWRIGIISFQFLVSAVMIIVSAVAYLQIEFIRDKELGFDKESIVAISNPYMLGPVENILRFRRDLRSIPGVEAASVTGYTPSQLRWSKTMLTFPDQDHESGFKFHAKWLTIDNEFVNTLGLTLMSGRNFKDSIHLDRASVLINKSALSHFGFTSEGDALGREVSSVDENGVMSTFEVIGVVNDFHLGSLHNALEPVIMKPGYHTFEIAARISRSFDKMEVVAGMERLWKNYNSVIPFQSTWINDRFERLHTDDRISQHIFLTICVIAIGMAVLGIYSIMSYAVASRSKAIGIRRILGASNLESAVLLSREFIRVIVIAIAIGIPLSALLVSSWLADFIFKVEISWWVYCLPVFILPAMVSLILFRLFARTFYENPIRHLKTE